MLVIGNGESRKDIDINKYGSIKVGCNAIFRDFYVNHLICCDRRMVTEAQQERNYGAIYTRPDWRDEFKLCGLVPQLPYKGDTRPDDPWHWGSGPYAVLLGTSIANRFSSGNPEISMIGFDLYSETKTVNNIYKGTENYEATESRPIDPSYWIYQIDKVFENFPDTTFYYYNNKPWPTKQTNVCNKMVIEFDIDNETT
tara:strand:+ start:1783 stop:2376 length:594 start_codon:yes stop_codon:yes gene_type:complete